MGHTSSSHVPRLKWRSVYIHVIISRGLDSIRKEKAMKTFRQTTVTFLETLAQLKRLEGPEKVTQAPAFYAILYKDLG